MLAKIVQRARVCELLLLLANKRALARPFANRLCAVEAIAETVQSQFANVFRPELISQSARLGADSHQRKGGFRPELISQSARLAV